MSSLRRFRRVRLLFVIKPQTIIIERGDGGDAIATNPWAWECLNQKWEFLLRKDEVRREHRRAKENDHDRAS